MAAVVDAVTSFSDKPLKIFFNLGIAIFLLSLCYACWLVFRKVIWGIDVEGWVSVMVSIWIFGGLIISQLGLLGMYLSKVFIETKARPAYIVKSVERGNSSSLHEDSLQ